MPDAPVTALRGTIVSFTGDPFLIDTAESYVHEPDGLIVCRNGIIEAVGAYDIYNHYGLVRRRTVLGHCVWFSDSGFASVHERDASIAHCPTSNLCLGSGQFRLRLAKDKKRPIHVGLGTDIGAGTSFSLLRTINEAYKIAALNAAPITAFEALCLATLGGACSLGLEDRIGSLEVGREADIVVLDPKATPLLEAQSRSLEETLFVLITLGDDRAVRATYVAGALAHVSDPVDA
jgi:guanine deaminase